MLLSAYPTYYLGEDPWHFIYVVLSASPHDLLRTEELSASRAAERTYRALHRRPLRCRNKIYHAIIV